MLPETASGPPCRAVSRLCTAWTLIAPEQKTRTANNTSCVRPLENRGGREHHILYMCVYTIEAMTFVR